MFPYAKIITRNRLRLLQNRTLKIARGQEHPIQFSLCSAGKGISATVRMGFF